MPQTAIGELNALDSFYDGFWVYLIGSGINPTLGWKNQFHTSLDHHSDWDFIQIPPSGFPGQVISPFFAVEKIYCDNTPPSELKVRHLNDKGDVEITSVEVRTKVMPADRLVIQVQNPVQLYLSGDDRVTTSEVGAYSPAFTTLFDKRTVFERTLASFDNPLDCCHCRWLDCTCRGSQTRAYIRITVSTPQDIEKAVEECLKVAAIAAALVAIAAAVSTGGAALNAALATFESIFKPCIIGKLSSVASVIVDSDSGCKD